MRKPDGRRSRGGKGQLVASLLAILTLTGCPAGQPSQAVARPGQRQALPPPRLSGPMSLEEALANRRSVREYGDEPLTVEEISQLLWAAQGLTDPRGLRTAPSAGALYPLEVYVATAEGAFHYLPAEHALEEVSAEDRRGALWQAALRQDPVREAPAVFVVAAVYERTERKYGAARTPRYVHLEAGHAAQNLLLQAVTLGLGGVPIGAFDDAAVQAALSLPAEEQPLYVIPVGHPRSR